MSGKSALAASVIAALCLLVFVASASAFKEVSQLGKGAGQTRQPEGLAVDSETGHLFVADTKNNRIDVFDAAGNFVKAFGWGTSDGKSKFESCTAVTTCREGLSGTGAGQFSAPTSIAVDNDPASTSHHDVYVVDQNNNRVEKFDAEGNFILAIGGGVDKTVPGNVCTAASGHTCGAGANGEGEGEFVSNEGSQIFTGVGPGGTVYVVDSPHPGSEFEIRLQKFEPSGAVIAPQRILPPGGARAGAMAVDPSGDLYVLSGGNTVRKYEESGGPPIAEIEAVFNESQSGVETLATDGAGNLFAVSAGTKAEVSILKFDSAGNRVQRFGYGSLLAFASALAPYHSASGDIYLGEGESLTGETIGNRVLQLDFPPPGPLVFPAPCTANPRGNSKATLDAEVNPEGKATTYHFRYVEDTVFQHDVAELGPGHGFDHALSTAESPPIESELFNLHKASTQVDVVPETGYHCEVVASNADAPGGITGPEGEFKTLKPLEIIDTLTAGVGSETATLKTEVNPLGIPATGFFEYVGDATYQEDVKEAEEEGKSAEEVAEAGFDHAHKAPDPEGEEPLDFGGGETPVEREVAIAGLAPGTTYHYRVVATDELIEPKTIAGPTRTFGTYPTGAGGLLDNRRYELVSPAQKNNAEVAVPGTAGGLFAFERTVRINAAAASGEAMTYTSWTSFAEPEGAPSTSQYVSKRGPGGWETENASPFGFLREPLENIYRGFTPDLAFGGLAADEALTPNAQEGFQNLYLRDGDSGALQALTIEEPQLLGGEGFCVGYAGASADGQHAVFAAKGAMTGAGAPLGKGFSLYEWSAGAEHLKLVSVLPDGTPAPPVAETGFGAAGRGGRSCSMDQAIVHNAYSANGSVAFWVYGGKYKNSEQPLFARINGSETVQLDAKVAGEANGGKGTFWGANADGSLAFFTAPGKLTADAKAGGQLYRYDTQAKTTLDLTPKANPEIEGVVGASEDGKYVYFVAIGALTGEEENAAHEKAEAGANNLYLSQEGKLRFIARLEGLGGDWESAPSALTARVSPDGRHLAFLSTEAEALSGFVNTIAPPAAPHCQPEIENKLGGDAHCAEAYLYDAEANTLVCASCNPAGSRPTGPAELPTWSNPYEGPRYLSDDGSRLYFESRDALSGADTNGRRDVYEFEQAGAGNCSAQSPDFIASSGGCLSLVSSGKSEDDSYLLDASSNGRDAFIATRQQLTGWDVDENYDVYDAREGGGFPEPQPLPASCEGEACKPTPNAPPPTAAASTNSFVSPGNPKPKKSKHHSKKGKHKKGKKHHKPKAGR